MSSCLAPGAWRQAARDRTSIGLLLIDADHFKSYNDHLGHLAGDDCLAHISSALEGAVNRPLDFVARYGGEEFAIVLYAPSETFLHAFAHRLNRIIRDLDIPHPASATASHVTISVGAGFFQPASEQSYDEAIALVDEALYAAKAAGRDRAEFVA